MSGGHSPTTDVAQRSLERIMTDDKVVVGFRQRKAKYKANVIDNKSTNGDLMLSFSIF